jgi:4-amino-4-deoxy-L-arabinose transferase-like glycosyltransferase
MLLLDRRELEAPPPPRAHRLGARGRTMLVLAASMLLALGLRLPYLHTPLGIDEGGVAFIAKAWGSGHGSLYGEYWLDRPPLLVALYKLALVGGATGIRVLGTLAALALVAGVTFTTRTVAGDRAARIAAVLSAALAGSVVLAAIFTPGELLASVPACASVGCLFAAHRRRQAGWMAAAGLLAVSAVLIKQSFLDAGFAGAVFLIASSVAERRLPLRAAAAYALGALLPLACVAIWLAVAHVSPGSLVYALFGFRIHALHALSASSLPLHVRVQRLVAPGEGSGLFVLLLVGLWGLVSLRRDRVVTATLAAWLAAGAVGVLAGGTYWPHYLIQLIAPACLLTGAALAPLRGRAVVAATIVALTIVASIGDQQRVDTAQARLGVLGAARYVRTHAHPGDTQYVLYARANVGYYTGLPSPYPYAWSLLIRAHPGAVPRLRQLLASPERPTWIVGWQRPSGWGLDPGGSTTALLRSHYRVVTHVHGHPIYHRTSSPRSSP